MTSSMLLMGCGKETTTAPPAPYTGPGDVVASAVYWGGLRGYNTAVTATGTQKAVNVRRSSDNTTQDIVILTTGALDIASATTFAGGSNLFVAKMYDQSGNGNDAVQATSGAQPQLFLSGGPSSGKPHMTFSNAQWLSTSSLTITKPFSYSLVAIRTGAFSSINLLVSPTADDGDQVWFGGSANQLTCGNSGFTITAADSTWHAIQYVSDPDGGPTASTLYLDGSGTTGQTVGGTVTTTVNFGSYHAGVAVLLNGDINEVGLWSTKFSGGNNSSIDSNQRTFWGF